MSTTAAPRGHRASYRSRGALRGRPTRDYTTPRSATGRNATLESKSTETTASGYSSRPNSATRSNTGGSTPQGRFTKESSTRGGTTAGNTAKRDSTWKDNSRGSYMRGSIARGSSTRGSNTRGNSARGGARSVRGGDSLGNNHEEDSNKRPVTKNAAPYSKAGKPPSSTPFDAVSRTTSEVRSFGRPSQGGQQSTGSNAPAQDWATEYGKLKAARVRERAQAIRNGLMADPNKRTTLAEAITVVGTCEDMCPKFERVQRAHERDIWREEANSKTSSMLKIHRQPDEARMVKKFRRAAAGEGEQLPSDLRPPRVLKKTCDYLFDFVLRNAPDWAVTSFIWDRTRSVRNDFSIQRPSKVPDVIAAVDCYERIARFHILSMHQCALTQPPPEGYDYQQDREQLDRTLLSLIQLYNNSRKRISHPNEAEFRAYQILIQIRLSIPDIEDQAQSWPVHIREDPRVRTALKLYAAAADTIDYMGPLVQGRTASQVVAQQHWGRFWQIVNSQNVGYLMACLAESWFQLIRRDALNGLLMAFRASRKVQVKDWTLNNLRDALFLDTEDEAKSYCKSYGFSFQENDDGQESINFNSVGKYMSDPDDDLRPQIHSKKVEIKRLGRSMPAIVNGMSFAAARKAGEVNMTELRAAVHSKESKKAPKEGTFTGNDGNESDQDTLFVSERKKAVPWAPSSIGSKTKPVSGFGAPSDSSSKSAVTTFGSLSQPVNGSPFTAFGISDQRVNGSAVTTFGAPGQPLVGNASVGNSNKDAQTQGVFSLDSTKLHAPKDGSRFNFLSGDSNTRPSNIFKPSKVTGPPGGSETPGYLKTLDGNPSGLADGSQSSSGLNWASGSTGHLATPITPALSTSVSGGFAASPTNDGGSIFKSFQQENEKPNQSPAKAEKSSPNTFDAHPAATPPKPSWATWSAGSVPAYVPSQPSAPSVLPSYHPPASFNFTTTSPPKESSPPTKTMPGSSPSHTSSSPAQQPHATNSAIASSTGAGVRKFSDSKPTRPSPLSQSVSAEETQHGAEVKPSCSSEAPPPVLTVKEPSFGDVMSRLAEEVRDDPVRGLLQQYLEYTVNRVIADVQEQLSTERANAEADEFRFTSLSHRFGRRWRAICYKRRLDRKARGARERRRAGLGSSRASFATDNNPGMREVTSQTAMNESSYQDMMRPRPDKTVMASTARLKRPFPPGSDLNSTAVGGKRRKSSHEYREGSTAAHNNPERLPGSESAVLKRSSFLGFSLSPNAPHKTCTTETNYFRLKAMGIKPTTDTDINREKKKRKRAEVEVDALGSAFGSLHQSTEDFVGEQATKRVENALVRTSSGGDFKRHKQTEEDEALFARLRAARDGLKESGSIFQRHTQNETASRNSLESSQGSTESASLGRARAEARLRASQYGDDFSTSVSTSRDVPAYRLRQSKFVPRSDYGLAIERSKEIRASRSIGSSRAESRAEQVAHGWRASATSTSAAGRNKPAPARDRSVTSATADISRGPATIQSSYLAEDIPAQNGKAVFGDQTVLGTGPGSELLSITQRSTNTESSTAPSNSFAVPEASFAEQFPPSYSANTQFDQDIGLGFGDQTIFGTGPLSGLPCTHQSLSDGEPHYAPPTASVGLDAMVAEDPPRSDPADGQFGQANVATLLDPSLQPGDYTIPRSQIEESLSHSFGPASQPPQQQRDSNPSRSFSPPLVLSPGPSAAISLPSSDAGEQGDEQASEDLEVQQAPLSDYASTDQPDDVDPSDHSRGEEAEQDPEDPYAYRHGNPYGILATEEHDNEIDNGVEGEDDENGGNRSELDDYGVAVDPNLEDDRYDYTSDKLSGSYQHTQAEDYGSEEDEETGSEEEAPYSEEDPLEEVDESEEEYDGDEDADYGGYVDEVDTEQDEDEEFARKAMFYAQHPAPSPPRVNGSSAFAQGGHSADAPIELDSD